MKFRALDVDGDWTFGKGINDYLQGSDAVAADIKTALQSFTNDCFFDATAGIDWFNLLGSNNEAALVFSVKSVLKSRQGVSSVNQVSVNRDEKRNLTLAYAVTTVFGSQVSAGAFSAPIAPYTGISKYINDIVFSGETTFDINVSSNIVDARNAVWILYNVGDGYSVVVGAVQPLNATTVRVTIVPGPTGTFRLVGIA